jgi:hypothetical protein
LAENWFWGIKIQGFQVTLLLSAIHFVSFFPVIQDRFLPDFLVCPNFVLKTQPYDQGLLSIFMGLPYLSFALVSFCHLLFSKFQSFSAALSGSPPSNFSERPALTY